MLNLVEDDRPAVDFAVSCIVSARLSRDAEPAWGILTGPPGSAKTEMLRPYGGLPFTFVCDEITSKALNSAMLGVDDPSLLLSIDDKVLLWPELTTLITQNPEEASAVMGSLRRCFDGEGLCRATGAGHKHLQAQFGFLACCTGRIDRFLVEHATLGDRFLKFRIQRSKPSLKDRLRLADHIQKAATSKDKWRDRLKGIAKAQIGRYHRRDLAAARPTIPPTIWEKYRYGMILVADSRALPALRGQQTLEDTESAHRIQQQIANLVWARSLLDGRHEWDDTDLSFALRVAVDTMPPESLRLLARLARGKPLSGLELARDCGIEGERINALLRQFTHAGLVHANTTRTWALTEDAMECWRESSLNEALPPALRQKGS